MLPWKLRKRHILPVNQNLSTVYFLLVKFQLVSCNLSFAMIWQMTYTHKLPKLCSATVRVSQDEGFVVLGTLTCLKSAFEVDCGYPCAPQAEICQEIGLSPPQRTSLAQLTQMTQSAPLCNTPDLLIMDQPQKGLILYWPAHRLVSACCMHVA